jgi:F0F1-type ATP synthase membrane subunit b/b'
MLLGPGELLALGGLLAGCISFLFGLLYKSQEKRAEALEKRLEQALKLAQDSTDMAREAKDELIEWKRRQS